MQDRVFLRVPYPSWSHSFEQSVHSDHVDQYAMSLVLQFHEFNTSYGLSSYVPAPVRLGGGSRACILSVSSGYNEKQPCVSLNKSFFSVKKHQVLFYVVELEVAIPSTGQHCGFSA